MGINDRRLRAFFAVRGYPDPATVSQERTIWAATEHRTRTSRICSASSTRQAVTVIDPEILKAVQTVYSTDLGLPEEWTPEQRTQFLTAEADKISSMAASMAEELWEKAIAVWSRNRNGKTPNHATKVALLEAARAQAAQTVLNNELYDLIETDETTPSWETPDPIPDPAHSRLGAALDEPGATERAQRGPRSADRPPVAGPGLFGTVPDQGGVPDLGPGRGRPAATRPPRGPLDRRVGADDLPRPARGRSTRAVGPQVSLFDDLADTETDTDSARSPRRRSTRPTPSWSTTIRAAPAIPEPAPPHRRRRRGRGVPQRRGLSGQHRRPGPVRSQSARPRQHRRHRTGPHAARRAAPGDAARAAHPGRLVWVGSHPAGLRSPRRGLHRRTSSTRRPSQPRAVPSRPSLDPQRPLHRPRRGVRGLGCTRCGGILRRPGTRTWLRQRHIHRSRAPGCHHGRCRSRRHHRGHRRAALPLSPGPPRRFRNHPHPRRPASPPRSATCRSAATR